MSPDHAPRATRDHGPGAAEPVSPARWRRWVVAFGHFWWDFLVGDTPELLLGSLVALGVAAFFVHGVGVRSAVVGALPALVVALLILSSLRARARITRSRSETDDKR